MAKLSDLVNVSHNSDVVTIQKAEIPISFGMESMEYIGDVYGEYAQFERDINEFLKEGTITFKSSTLKIIRALIYGMVRSGGTECTPEELNASMPFNTLPAIFETCLDVFTRQNFQESDLKK
ncbi:hypothetical protein [Brochothrix campestris]|uniref:Phage protein n=1 Tax=Brochothrix campestris FSL F6-1037 TaxID=1265861 RepID=W7D9N8_9LIST|nr:hypothetical protein [Brochothrix campestris]EUJ41978.1 Phage protein [Brochothrix campestris FSL F6-1037]